MGTQPQRLCINCKHMRKQFDIHKCYRKAKVRRSQPDPVSGHVSTYVDDTELCSEERRWFGPYCGPSGIFYEESRLTKRLITWFKA